MIAPIKSLTATSAASVFQSSLEAIRNTLSADDQAAFRTFPNYKVMVAEMKLMSEQFAHKNKLAGYCRKIESFAKAFAPYFEVVNIFVQIKPDWMGWFWGSLRLIFQVTMAHLKAYGFLSLTSKSLAVTSLCF